MFQEYIQLAPVASFIFAATLIASLLTFSRPQEHRNLMLHPYSVARGRKLYTVLTSGFVHADLAHLIFNMVTFYFFAFPLELYMRVLAGGNILGHIIFGVVYIVSMILADIYSIFRHKNNAAYFSLGASGAISAVLFSYILFNPGSNISVFMLPSMPAPLFALLYIGFTWYASRKQFDNINHDAHLWGAVAGIVLTLVFFPHVGPMFIDQIREMLNM
jgi:membrane associated rhomboid family serine protease